MRSEANATGDTRHSFRYGDETIRFVLRRQAGRKTNRIAIHVESSGRVIVDASEDAAIAEVLPGVKKRARWIAEHVSAARARLAHVLPREYVSGESLSYLGRRYQLRVRVIPDEVPRTVMRGAYIDVTVPVRDAAKVRSALETWFRHRARDVLSTRLAEVAAPLRWVKQLPPVRMQVMAMQWGSCSPAGRLTLNPHLVKAPRECIDYVLLHELCHLQHHNHSPHFYRALDRHMPRWRAIKERLDQMAEQLLSA
jgi:predicted metal-dependent hydrolase